MKYLALFFLAISFNVYAGYQCELALSEDDQINKTIASKTVIASEKDLKSEIIDNFYSVTDGRTLVLKVFIDGWNGEEEMSATVFTKTKSGEKLEPLSEKVSLRGDDKETLWFDSYKLKVTCSLA